LPSFFKARKQAQRNTCLNNLRMLTSPMTCCVPLSYKLKDGDTMDPKTVLAFVKGATMPTCPAGGEYKVTWIVGGPTPKCSHHGDLLLEVDQVKDLKDLEDNHEDIKMEPIKETQQSSGGDGDPARRGTPSPSASAPQK